jgi:hypothetical protein
MPMDYYCEGCGLVFSVGRYATRSRYPSRTLLVCWACGTVHEHQEPLREAEQGRLLAQPGPMISPRRPERPTFLDRRLHWEGLVPPPGQERWGPELQAVACSHCGAPGTLAESWTSENRTCPRCREDRLVEVGGWIT